MSPLATELQSSLDILNIWTGFRKDVLDCLKKTPADKFNQRPETGWSISEIGEHLYLTEWSFARSVPIAVGGKFGSDTDAQENLNYREMRAGLTKPRGFKNPDTVSPLSNYTLEQLLPLLEKSHKKLEEVLSKFSKADLQKRGYEHPAFGLLNLFNYSWVLALHEGAHLVALKQKTSGY